MQQSRNKLKLESGLLETGFNNVDFVTEPPHGLNDFVSELLHVETT